MNKQQRKQIAELANELSILDAVGLMEMKPTDEIKQQLMLAPEASLWDVIEAKLDEFKSRVESIRDEEQEKYDNMPESLQGGDKGDAMQEGIQYLEDSMDALDSAIEAADAPEEGTTDEEQCDAIAEHICTAVDELNNI